MSALTDLTLVAMRDGLAKGDFSSVELTQAHIDQAAASRGLNVYVTETVERALADARAADARRGGGALGPLDGVPVAIKDMFCTQGVRTTASSKILENFTPPYESSVTAKLWAGGAGLLGKTSCDEFAMGSANITSAFGPVANPWKAQDDDYPRTPGGSSGGAAAAVAARMAPLALGTDTGGSIRQPAAFCGVVGAKPTYGRCSRWGIVAFASSLDQAGPFTRTVEDCAIALDAICGFDAKDSTSSDKPVPAMGAELAAGVKGLKIGLPKEYRIDGAPAEIEALWAQGAEWLREAGAEIVEVSLPHTKYALPAYYVIAPAEASSNLARYDGVRYGKREAGDDLIELYENSRAAGFGAEVRRRVLIGAYALSAGYYDAYYLQAQKVRRRIQEDFAQVFERCDALLTPTTPNAAFPLDDPPTDPVAMYLNDVFTVTVNLAGLPAISVPAGLDGKGLPLGLQVIAKPWDEPGMLRVAAALEAAAGFDARPGGVK